MKKIVCISDTHREEHNIILPKGDILIHSGDFDITDEFSLQYILNWFSKLNYEHIIFIGGNHDLYLEAMWLNNLKVQCPDNVHYLMNSGITIDNIKIWGSPFSPPYNNWAFMRDIDTLRLIWDTIPSDTDIVITHCPPMGINDQVKQINQGCWALHKRLKKIKPKYHIHGHIHEGYGVYQNEKTTYVNASLMDGFYNLYNKPVEIEYENDLS